MRIIFNTHILRPPRTGIGHYTLQLAQALNRLGHEVRGLTLDPLAPPTPLTHSDSPAWRKGLARLPGARTLRRIRLQVKLDRQAAPGWLYHETNYIPLRFDGPTVITVHDLAWIRHPETHPIERVRYLEHHFPRALERADHILTVSEFTRAELMQIFDIPAERITVTHLGVDHQVFRPHTEAECLPILSKYGLTWRGYILSVGTLEPRKNLHLALEAHRRLPIELQRGFPLILVGARGWHTTKLQEILHKQARQGTVKPLGYVPDSDLPSLYAGARAFVYPSRYEGFGLPPLEAMACGTPVIVSDAKALTEVGGDAVLTVPQEQPALLETAFQALLEDETQVAALSERGLQRAAGMTWTACAQATLAGYKAAEERRA